MLTPSKSSGGSCTCCGCGVVLPERSGPVHRYMDSSPACWAMYGEVLAREYGSPAHSRLHRLTVDAYAAQHPGTESRQSSQSVAVHLSRLCLMLDHDFSMERANDAMLAIVQNEKNFRWLEPPKARGAVTVADVHAAGSPEEHLQWVQDWARSVWAAWSAHHAVIHEWLPGGLTKRSKRV